jgi:hypothetical protein
LPSFLEELVTEPPGPSQCPILRKKDGGRRLCPEAEALGGVGIKGRMEAPSLKPQGRSTLKELSSNQTTGRHRGGRLTSLIFELFAEPEKAYRRSNGLGFRPETRLTVCLTGLSQKGELMGLNTAGPLLIPDLGLFRRYFLLSFSFLFWC